MLRSERRSAQLTKLPDTVRPIKSQCIETTENEGVVHHIRELVKMRMMSAGGL